MKSFKKFIQLITKKKDDGYEPVRLGLFNRKRKKSIKEEPIQKTYPYMDCSYN